MDNTAPKTDRKTRWQFHLPQPYSKVTTGVKPTDKGIAVWIESIQRALLSADV